MMKHFIPFVLLGLLFLSSCDSNKSQIKKDLNTRWTKFEIVEIRPDSANLRTALECLSSLKLRVAITNREISEGLYNASLNLNPYENYLKIDSIHEGIVKAMDKFEHSQFDRCDRCYYVKYLVSKDEQKITKEEYYYVDKDYVRHRPIVWNEFMYDQEYDKLIKEAIKFSSEIFDLEWKYRNVKKQ